MSADDDIPKSIANRFKNLDFDDAPSARKRSARPRLPDRVKPRSKTSQPAPEPRVLPPTMVSTPPRTVSEPPRQQRPPEPEPLRTVPVPVPMPRRGATEHHQAPRRGAGVIIEEITIRRGAPRSLPAALGPATAPGVHRAPAPPPQEPGWPTRRRGGSPITLTVEAARQIRLMAHHAGVPGAGLRLLVGRSARPEDCDFVFEAVAEPDDVVIREQGVHIYLDPHAFNVLRGLHIAYDDLPGLAGFRVARLHRG